MKNNFCSITLLVLLSLAPASGVLHAQKPFEGTITWSMTIPQLGDDEKHPVVINVKGGKTETESEMGAMGAVKSYSDDSAKKVYMVMGAMKSGYVMDMDDPALKKANQSQTDSLDLTPSGKKETIAGHPSEEYLLKGLKNSQAVSIWVTGDFPKSMVETFYHSMNKPGQDPKQTKAFRALADKGLVPIRVVVTKDGEVFLTMEFVKYEQKSLDDALFVPPADVKFSAPPQMGHAGMN